MKVDNFSQNQTDVDVSTEDTSLRVARHRLVRPTLKTTLKSLEPFTESDEDETMMKDHADGDARETGAVKIFTKHAVTTHCMLGVVHVSVAPSGVMMQHASPAAGMGYQAQAWW